MIKAEKLSYSFPQKDLYNKISFTLEDDVHCAFIGTNGTGKSTLVDMILHPDNYLYDGRLIVDVPGRIGYVSQFYSLDEEKEVTVFDYLSVSSCVCKMRLTQSAMRWRQQMSWTN